MELLITVAVMDDRFARVWVRVSYPLLQSNTCICTQKICNQFVDNTTFIQRSMRNLIYSNALFLELAAFTVNHIIVISVKKYKFIKYRFY